MTDVFNFKMLRFAFISIFAILIINAIAQAQLSFKPIIKSTNSDIILNINAPSGQLHRLQVSENLQSWLNLATFAVSLGTCSYTDGAAPYLPQRFYRAVQMPNTNYIWGDHIQTDDGEVIIQPINHATFVMQWGTNTLYFDPTGAASRYAHLLKPTLLFLTHAHSDHYSSSTIQNIITNYTKIISPNVVWNQLPSMLKPYSILLTNGMTTNLNGIRIEAIPMYNLTSSYHVKGDGNGYILTIGNKRFYISGDTEDIPEMRALRNIDVAFLAMNKPYTMNAAQAASAVREFKPKIVYPFHYSPSTPATDFNAFRQAVGTDLGIEIRLRKWY
ncbi:MAG: MBL fold metallo-hydrolase [Verrucomicrobiia bacterium]